MIQPSEIERINESIKQLDAGSAKEYVHQVLELYKEWQSYIDSLIAQRAEVVEKIELFEHFLGTIEPRSEEGQTQATGTTVAPFRHGEFKNFSTREAAKIVLQRSGTPMFTRDITEPIKAGGKNLGKNEVSTVSAAMQFGEKKGEFTSERRKGRKIWRLKEETISEQDGLVKK